ncbi:site-specific integrase [Parabacteroides sp. OttesenSCG-928-N08]|nr:site-specific integrase [Parabacteroides sp. OttesenSCG-928-N08]
MKRKSLVQQAVEEIPGFLQSYTNFSKKLYLKQKSSSTIDHYTRCVAHLCLYCKKLPEMMTAEEVDDYLVYMLKQGASRSQFKHILCGLRWYFKINALAWLAVSLPSIPRSQPLPVVLSYQECKRLFHSPDDLKHKVFLSLVYSAGLRAQEVRNLRLEDIDFDRKMIHIRNSKYRKDRYVPLSDHIIRGLKKYYAQCNPKVYCFNSKEIGKPLTRNTAQWIMRDAVKKAGITKHATLHTLRHSYATHLLEMGMNIRQLMSLMGHSNIESTMVYLHLINSETAQTFSPFDRIWNTK